MTSYENEKLAETLKKMGIAFSDTQASELANDLISTETKVRSEYENKKTKETMKTRFSTVEREFEKPEEMPQAVPTKPNPAREVAMQAAEEDEEEDEKPEPPRPQPTPNFSEAMEKISLRDQQIAEIRDRAVNPQKIEISTVFETPGSTLNELYSEKPIEESEAIQEEEAIEEKQEETVQEVEQPTPVQEPVEAPEPEAQPTNDHSDMPESNVDLSSVFNFGNR